MALSIANNFIGAVGVHYVIMINLIYLLKYIKINYPLNVIKTVFRS